MFQSTGIPFGLFSAMKPWKLTIRQRTSAVTVSFGLVTSRIGIMYSVTVPKCAPPGSCSRMLVLSSMIPMLTFHSAIAAIRFT